jgi:translation initiation factor IF-2
MAKTYMIVFGIMVSKEVKEYALSRNVMIFEHDIIYKLFDLFMLHVNKIKLEERKVLEEKVIYPCILSILPDCIYNRESPIIVGVHVDQGILRRLTPIFVNGYTVGKVKSIEKNNKALDEAVVGDNVCIMIEQSQTLFQYSYGRHFTHSNLMYSKITKESIHAMQLLHPTMVEQYATLIEELKSIL